MGWLRNLIFEPTVEAEYVDEHGRKKTKRISKRRFDAIKSKAIADGAATIHDACQVHILDPRGSRVENWIIGQQVKRETYNKFKDSNGHLYVAVSYDKGEPNVMVVQKAMWEQVAGQFSNIDREASASFEQFKHDWPPK